MEAYMIHPPIVSTIVSKRPFWAFFFSFLSLSLWASPGQGQQKVFVPDGQASSGKVNQVPLGGKGPFGSFQNMRTQIRIPASFFPAGGSTIKDLGFAAGGKGTYSYKTFVLTLAHLKGTSLSKTFADNLAGPVEVLRESSHKLLFPKADTFHLAGIKTSFRHDGKHDLILDIQIQGAFFNGTTPGSHRSSTLETIFALDYSFTKPKKTGFGPYKQGTKLVFELEGKKIVYFGTACKASNGKVPALALSGVPTLGKAIDFSLSDLGKNMPSLFLVGNSDAKWGGFTLPLNLNVLGAKGCSLLTNILVMGPGSADANGLFKLSVPIPNIVSLRGTRMVLQGIALDPKANPLGMAFSRGARTAFQ
jgi:hypothetical protein